MIKMRMAQFQIEENLWFDFRIACRRHSQTIADVLPALIQAKLATWAQQGEAPLSRESTEEDNMLSESDRQRHLYGSDD